MTVIDPWTTPPLKALADARDVCANHSLLNDLGAKADLEYLQEQVKRQAADNLGFPGWTLHVSLKMRKDKLDPRKLAALAEEVGLDRVDGYLVSALLLLMYNEGIINIEVTS